MPYKEFEHPRYGTILIGGTTKHANRVAPVWAQEEECHRNFAFTMYHADEMPKVEWGLLQVRKDQLISGKSRSRSGTRR